MNWAIPSAPAGEIALGSNRDSAISCAASKAPETFQRAAERMIGPRNRDGTNEGSPPAERPPSPVAPIALPASEQGGGPAANPKCQASHPYRRTKPKRRELVASQP